MSRRKRRVFTQEQKSAAVKHLHQTGKTVYQAAQELDLPATALRRWVRESEIVASRGPVDALTREERNELRGLRRENQRLRLERDFQKESRCLLRQRVLEKYELVEAEKTKFPRCKVLDLSGDYAWLSRPESKKALVDSELTRSIHASRRKARGTYPSPRVTQDLKPIGHQVGRLRVVRLMREQGLQGPPRRRFQVPTTSDPSLAVESNRLARAFMVKEVNRNWASGLTYLWTKEGWLYLAVVLDLVSRRVEGWSLGEVLSTELPLDAIRMALGHRPTTQRHHSDPGCREASVAYRTEWAKHMIERSRSRKGDCWDNAAVESFFSTLKREFFARSPWQTRARARMDIFEYLKAFFNRR